MLGSALATSSRTDGVSVEDVISRLREADRLNAEAVGMIGALSRTARIEAETGLPAEMALRLLARRPGWEARE